MFDTLPRFAVDFLDSAIAWVYSFQPTFEPTVILGKGCLSKVFAVTLICTSLDDYYGEFRNCVDA